MSLLAKILSLSYDSASATKTSALKTYYRSVRFIKDADTVNPEQPSYITNVLLNGKCIDPETRCLYVFYVDTYYNSAWIIEINLDNRVQTVVYYDKTNAIGFDPLYKIYNARVVHGRLVWTDNKNPIYQMDIERAKKSFYYKIGYGNYPNTAEWDSTVIYEVDQIVSNGNYFYKSNITGNTGTEPRTDDGTLWTKLCLIQDAYYSINVKNFYFEPSPPKLPPVVEYITDDTRKVNSLRQTLFQIAYRYVYIDYRKSTFSPASITPVPQAEEQTATGLANENVSLNNALKITVNTGGEEVRSIEIVARSSDDPSKWYLIETIDKFDEEENAGEVSPLKDAYKSTITITVAAPSVISSGVALPDGEVDLLLTIISPSVVNSYVLLSETDLEWEYDEYYPLGATLVTVTTILAYATITSMPTWLTVFHAGSPLSLGDTVSNGDDLYICPTIENKLSELNDVFIITDPLGDTAELTVKHKVNPYGVVVYVYETTPPPLIITDNGCTGTYGSADIVIRFTPNVPDYVLGDTYSVNYTILKNGSNVGTGTFTVNEEAANTKSLTMGSVALNGDIISVYLQYNS